MNPYHPFEANNNLSESSQTHCQHAYVANGGIRPLLSPSSSSDNRGRRKIARFTGQTDITALLPQLQPQNPQQGLFLGMQQQNQNQLLFPQPMQQSQPSQPSLVNPMQQSQWLQPLLLRPMKQGQVLPVAQQLQSQRRPALSPQQLLLPYPQQQSQPPRQQLTVSLQQSQEGQWAQVNPAVMGRWTQRINKREQRISETNFPSEIMHDQWIRPQNNSIEFWSQYVAKYYDPKARERWCLSKCKDIMIPIRKDGKSCILCGWMPQKGYDVSFEELPARLKTKFDRMMGDRLSPGKAQEHRSKNGVTIVLYTNATHQCMYALECVIYTGLLRLAITNQRKILEWEFCASDRKTYFKIRRPFSSCSDNLLEIGEILRRPEAKNISDESTEENLQRNSQMEQAAQPPADPNVSRSTGIMQQANSLEHQIKQTTMNVSRATLSSPTSHDGSNQQNADRMSGKRPVSVNANSNETSGWSYEYMVTCLLTNASANLEQEISQNAMSNLQARHPDDGSSQMIVGGETTYEVSGDGVTGSMKMAQAAAASPVGSRGAGLMPDLAMEAQAQDIPVMENPAMEGQTQDIPVMENPAMEGQTQDIPVMENPAMEGQTQDIPVMENPASTDLPPSNQNTTNSQTVMDDLQIFIQKLNDDEFEMLNNFNSYDYDRTEATPLENVVDRETYLAESTTFPQV